MELKRLPYDLTVCKLADGAAVDLSADFYFLSKLSGILAERGIGIFAVSTYNTDYILVKAENYEKALEALAAEGYRVE